MKREGRGLVGRKKSGRRKWGGDEGKEGSFLEIRITLLPYTIKESMEFYLPIQPF